MKKGIAGQITIFTSAFFLLLAVVTAIAWQFQDADDRKLEAIYVVVALSPFIFYLFISDKLKQFKGGGIELTLRDEAEKEVNASADDQTIEFTPESEGLKQSISALQQMLDTNPPTTLAFVIGQTDYYTRQGIAHYIDELSVNPDFRYVLFKNQAGKFLGYMHIEDYKKLLDTDSDLVDQIETGMILQKDSVIQGAVRREATNKQALNKMDSLNLGELAVLDENDRFVGTITQDEIVRKILTNVIRES